jgi:dolichol-phosphate mannosyltransferase
MLGLSLVIPLFEEADNVEPLVAELLAVQRRLDLPSEIVLVDDGSRDDTLERLELAHKDHPGLRVLTLPANRGQSAALCAGIRFSRLSHVATLDGDLQNDPLDLLRMLPLCAGHDVVIGRRAQRRDSWSRRAAAWGANRVRGWLLRDGASDTGCSLKVFPRDEFLALPAFDGMHRFLPALFRAAGASLCEVEVNHRVRRSGRSKYTNLRRLRRTIPDLLGVLWLQRRRVELGGLRPLP